MRKTVLILALSVVCGSLLMHLTSHSAHASFYYPGLTITYTPVKTNFRTFDFQKKLSPVSFIHLTPTPKQRMQYNLTPSPTQATEKIVQVTYKVLAEKAPSQTPTPSPVPVLSAQLPNSGGLDPEKLFTMSNTYRVTRGLPAFQKDERACQLAQSRAPEIAEEVSSGMMHVGLKARNLPYWNTENIISMRNEDEAFNWWINDTIHREAIEGNYTYSCVACFGNSCAQEFTNFQPK